MDFSWLDWVLMVFYLIAMLAMSAYFFLQAKHQKAKGQFDNSKYLTAKGMKIPAIVIGLSIWATGLSSITFLSTPGIAFKTGWMWAITQLSFFLVVPILIKFVIPFYRRMTESTAYAYLQKRFSYSLRAIASISFILFHIFRIAIVLYIPTLALSLFVNINSYLLLFIVIVVVVISTFLGGFKGVLWTDAVQGFVLFIGILLILIFGLAYTNWNSDTIKYSFFTKENQWKIDLASGGIFFIFLSKIIENTFTYTASQDIVQRYKTGQNINAVIKSIHINIILVIITLLVFYGVGSMLYTYYSSRGINVDDSNAISQIVGVENAANNQLLSYFIISVLPMGISGLILSAVFAASQSTISSSLNSLVTTIVVDFWRYFYPQTSDKTLNIWSKILIIVFGIFGFMVSALLIYTKEENIINYFLSIIGLFAAPVAGTFILGIFTKRTNSQGALVGLICGFLVSFPLWLMTQKFIPESSRIVFGPAWITIISFLSSLSVGYFTSFIFASFLKQKSIINLSVWTKTKEFDDLLKLEKLIYKQEKLYKKTTKGKEQLSNLVQQFDSLTQIVHEQIQQN